MQQFVQQCRHPGAQQHVPPLRAPLPWTLPFRIRQVERVLSLRRCTMLQVERVLSLRRCTVLQVERVLLLRRHTSAMCSKWNQPFFVSLHHATTTSHVIRFRANIRHPNGAPHRARCTHVGWYGAECGGCRPPTILTRIPAHGCDLAAAIFAGGKASFWLVWRWTAPAPGSRPQTKLLSSVGWEHTGRRVPRCHDRMQRGTCDYARGIQEERRRGRVRCCFCRLVRGSEPALAFSAERERPRRQDAVCRPVGSGSTVGAALPSYRQRRRISRGV
jgi:hypothetical protein